MKRKGLAILASVLILALLAACTTVAASAPTNAIQVALPPPATTPVSEPPTDQPHGAVAMRHIEFMNDHLPARTAFSYRELETALWIIQQLLAMGYTWEDIQVQEFGWPDVYQWAWRGWEQMQAEGFFRYSSRRQGDLSQNIILTVPGRSEQVIVVGAHYDSFPYPGAADNASGTALLLESAHRMMAHDNYHTIVYVFFGAEEVGLLGAEYYIRSLTDEQRERIILVVNADALFEGPYLLYATGQGESREQGAQANDVSRRVDAIAYQFTYQFDIPLTPVPQGIFWYTDHLPFVRAGHTVLVLAGLDSVRDYSLYRPEGLMHTPRDCLHYINAARPGMAEFAMWTYSVFLERILLSGF